MRFLVGLAGFLCVAAVALGMAMGLDHIDRTSDLYSNLSISRNYTAQQLEPERLELEVLDGQRQQPELLPPPMESDVDLQGIYLCSGKNPDDDSEYQAVVTVRRQQAGYRIQWNIENYQPAFGIGMRRGSELLVGSVQPNGVVVVRYKIEAKGPRLVGEWMGRSGEGSTETLEFLGKLP
jgi:hypothetical protein